MAAYSSTLGWKISWTEEPGAIDHTVAKELDMTQPLNNKTTKKVAKYLFNHYRKTVVILGKLSLIANLV